MMYGFIKGFAINLQQNLLMRILRYKGRGFSSGEMFHTIRILTNQQILLYSYHFVCLIVYLVFIGRRFIYSLLLLMQLLI